MVDLQVRNDRGDRVRLSDDPVGKAIQESASGRPVKPALNIDDFATHGV